MSCVIISKRAETKYLSEYFSKYLYYFFINKNLSDDKSDLSENTKLYRKFFDTKISKLDISEDREDGKTIRNYILLKQQLEL